MRKIKKSKASMPEQLALEFKRRIANGIYPANSFIPPERDLATEFDVCRDTIAAALTILTNEGLAERRRGRGTRILHCPETDTLPVGCVVYGQFQTNWPENLRMIEGVQNTLTRLGYKHELIGVDFSRFNGTQWPPLSNEEVLDRFCGVIYLESAYCNEQIMSLHQQNFPVVVANLEIDLDVSCTWVNHEKTTKEAVKILAGLGHKRIAYLGREPNAYFYGKSVEGYNAGLVESGLCMDESLMGIIESSSPLLAYIKTRELLSLPNPPTAIIAARDLYAEGAYEAAHKSGLIIGRDISIIGYDDITWPAEEPFLTTFREPCYELGSVASEIFLEKFLVGNMDIIKREIESPFIMRRSAGPLI